MAENITYKLADLGSPLFTSRSSQVFLLKSDDSSDTKDDSSKGGDAKVGSQADVAEKLLKLFNPEVSQEMIDNEEINTKETYEKGISAVECYGQARVECPDGTIRSGLIIKKIPGQTLIARAMKKPATVFSAPKTMARLHIAMHNTHTDKIRSYKDLVKSSMESDVMSFLTDDERIEIKNRLDSLPDGDSILHLDYHPDNIMSDGNNTSVIDWMTSAKGTPAADVAATLYLLNEGEMIPGLNPAVASVLEFLRKSICKKYLKKYKAATGMTDEQIAPWRLPFLIVRLGVWAIDSEITDLQRKIREELVN